MYWVPWTSTGLYAPLFRRPVVISCETRHLLFAQTRSLLMLGLITIQVHFFSFPEKQLPNFFPRFVFRFIGGIWLHVSIWWDCLHFEKLPWSNTQFCLIIAGQPRHTQNEWLVSQDNNCKCCPPDLFDLMFLHHHNIKQAFIKTRWWTFCNNDTPWGSYIKV